MAYKAHDEQATGGERSPEVEAPAGRHRYRLVFQKEGKRSAKEVEFEATDIYQTFEIAHTEARSRAAELWRDGAYLCTIRGQPSDVWEITWSRTVAA